MFSVFVYFILFLDQNVNEVYSLIRLYKNPISMAEMGFKVKPQEKYYEKPSKR